MYRKLIVRVVPALVATFLMGGVRGFSLRAAAGQAAQAPASSADISGKWHFIYQTEGGERENDGNFIVNGDQVSGKYASADVKGTYKDGDLNLAFPFDSDEAGMKAILKMKGKLKDGKLVGTWEFADYSGEFTATRPAK